MKMSYINVTYIKIQIVKDYQNILIRMSGEWVKTLSIDYALHYFYYSSFEKINIII